MKIVTNAALVGLALSAVTMSAEAQQLRLAGSDSFEPIASPFFNSNSTLPGGLAPSADLSSFLAYAGGGQTPGETALKNASTTNQVVAFFTSQLTDSGTNNVCTANPNAQDLVLGIDGVINIANPARFPGGQPTLGPTVLGSTLTWQNALTILYLGYDARTGTQDCNSDTRRALAADFGSLFSSGGASIPANTPIRHLFHRDETTGTSKALLSLLGVPSANQKYCNGTVTQDLDPIRRLADVNDQVAEYDGTLGLTIPITVPTFSNNPIDLYTGADGVSPAAFGKFNGGQSSACASGPSSIDPSSAGPGVAASAYAGLVSPAATLPNTPRCDCRFPVPSNFPVPTSSDAQKFNWNVKLGIGCQGAQANTTPAWNVLNGDDGTRENTPPAWGTRVATTVNGLPAAQRCCNVGNPLAFRREDPRLLNLFVRDVSNGNLKPSNTAPLLAFYRLASTNPSTGKGLSNVGKTFTTRCQQITATDLQVSCLVQNVPNQLDSLGFGALTIYKDSQANLGATPTALNLNTDPVLNNYETVRNKAVPGQPVYGLARFVFLSSLRGFANLGESAAADTHSLASLNYDGSPYVPGATPTAQQLVDAQWNLTKAFYLDAKQVPRSSSKIETLGFLALPAGTDPYAVACTDDANSSSAPRIALDNSTYLLK